MLDFVSEFFLPGGCDAGGQNGLNLGGGRGGGDFGGGGGGGKPLGKEGGVVYSLDLNKEQVGLLGETRE